MNILKHCWGHAVLTACYLINRMPSTVLNGQISYFVLYLKHNMFPLPPRIFGCVFLLMIAVPITPNWILNLSNVSFWDILEVKKDIDASVPLCISLWSLQMLYFSSPHHTLIKRLPILHRQNQKTISSSFRKLIIFICQCGSHASEI